MTLTPLFNAKVGGVFFNLPSLVFKLLSSNSTVTVNLTVFQCTVFWFVFIAFIDAYKMSRKYSGMLVALGQVFQPQQRLIWQIKDLVFRYEGKDK